MKRKTLIRAAAALCLLTALAACGRDPAPPSAAAPEATPSAEASAPASEETRNECLRLVSNSLEQHKSELPLYELLALDKEVFFTDYTGGGFQVVHFERARTENDPLLSTTYLTNDAYFWYDRSGEATPEQAAQELVTVMLGDLKSQPEFGRTFTITDYSVKDQTLCAWENIPERVLGGGAYDIDGLSHDEAVEAVREQLSRDILQRETPFDYTGFAFALGEDMWALDPYFTFDYTGVVNGFRREAAESRGLTADGDGLFEENQRGKPDKCAHILMRDGSVWRMQRAEAMERMFADTARTERMGGYTLSQLEHSLIEGGREYYIEGAGSEYLRRLQLDPEPMYEHMDELGLPRLAYLCNQLSYEANSDGYTPEGDSYSAELLKRYTDFRRNDRNGNGDDPAPPPATGIICPPLLSEDTRAMFTGIQYADDRLLIFQAGPGLFAYDFEKGEIVFSADVLTAVGWASTQGSWVTHALVDADGGRIRLAYFEESWDHCLVLYEIDTADWSWKSVEYELSNGEMDGVFEYDAANPEHGKIDYRTKTGTSSTNLLRDLVYIRGGEVIRLFDGVDFDAYGEITPVPSADLERSVHNVLLSRTEGLPGGFKCEAHETLDARPDGAGNTVCYLAFQCEAFSSAGGEPLSTAFERSCAALTFRPDENGRYVLTDLDSPSDGPWGEEIARIFPEDLRGTMFDSEIEDRLSRSCLSQAADYFAPGEETD